ncbi:MULTISPECIES: 23S rRNA pseudouridine(2605) synthase RluB [unclassified Pseudomonas]|uniref:23S rRNA pseudouridine(2605) synthase RluB n=1 Tax=unclassified Pseudomonas TaxID=196821 RepID=UPI000C86BD5F|nr:MULTISPECIES: pseudouridine synthase [unclassified Pseudomonas]PMV23034.1 23S rRNA pseudouridylate synthase B [Pseudomonas sp. FW305-3-2-15-C-TSA2]PMV29771.1 23S rRNA pseudouridylate synthase B [Pseudomonas sp. DP16D-L5]PMV39862.1 23S rRNA pseudouridylate synthase B [Pseudomonas sp. FW305-3-2-15-A-LB2]PMV46191.1 23S rRNA pseudouridylate synthase B [Pseudomonas sp. FW305-3-2-15-C-R2A1]PMV51573.1 23S rRNA pseudouridylate synthase B [Pseudomonas sp. FW305-3-2-15-C-LB1]
MNDKDQNDSQEIGPAGEKLQKVLARIGVGSRRDVEAWITQKRIKVNGVEATLGQRVDLHDAITIDGKVIKREEAAESVRRVIMYNKPDGEICTRDDPEGRPTVFDKMPKPKEGRWINIGRLDINTTGLLMFTTDGELANRLMHPSYEMDREYAVRVRGEVDDEMIERLKAGVVLEDGPAKFTDIKQAPGGEGFNHWYHCVVMEGRNREVRRLWESQGLVVSRLKRVRFGPVFLNSDLPMGRWREMSQYEVYILSAEVGLTPVAMPQMNAKSKDKLERMQRKSSRPVARTERVARTLRPALNAPATGGRISREPQIEGERRPTAPSRQEGERAPRAPRAPRPAPAGGRSNRGEADRPADNASTKRPARPAANKRPGPKLVADEPSGKRRGAPAGSGQRPGFGRKKPQ